MEKNEKKLTNFDSEEWRVGPKAFISLAAAILFFSGIMTGFDGMKWLSAFDFSTLIGKFGTVKTLGKDTFVGTGGLGARGGFMFALSLVPSVMLAIGCLEVLSHYGAIKAAHKLLTPLLRPLLGVPGLTGLALITDLQSTECRCGINQRTIRPGPDNKKRAYNHRLMAIFRCRTYQQLFCYRFCSVFLFNRAAACTFFTDVCF